MFSGPGRLLLLAIIPVAIIRATLAAHAFFFVEPKGDATAQ